MSRTSGGAVGGVPIRPFGHPAAAAVRLRSSRTLPVRTGRGSTCGMHASATRPTIMRLGRPLAQKTRGWFVSRLVVTCTSSERFLTREREPTDGAKRGTANQSRRLTSAFTRRQRTRDSAASFDFTGTTEQPKQLWQDSHRSAQSTSQRVSRPPPLPFRRSPR